MRRALDNVKGQNLSATLRRYNFVDMILSCWINFDLNLSESCRISYKMVIVLVKPKKFPLPDQPY